MNITHNVVGWFEIPVHDLDRAVKFYESVFGYTLERVKIGDADMAWFPSFETEVGAPGALIHSPEFSIPANNGTLVYFTAFSGDLSNELGRVEQSGGKIVMPKTEIAPDIGFMAVFMDTEGNRVAMHARG